MSRATRILSTEPQTTSTLEEQLQAFCDALGVSVPTQQEVDENFHALQEFTGEDRSGTSVVSFSLTSQSEEVTPEYEAQVKAEQRELHPEMSPERFEAEWQEHKGLLL